MQRYKLSSGMPVNHPVTRGDQLRVAGKISSIERPVRMIIQLFVALVEAIRGGEKCNRIRNVNCHGNVELSASVPHGIKTDIVNFHQRARSNVFSKIESQGLENLQAASPITMGPLYSLRLHFRVIRLLEAGIRGLGERVKAAGV